MSMLTRAAKRFDTAFAALPIQTQRAIALAMYRAAPAMTQYQKDLEPLTRDPALTDAVWDVLIGAAFQVVKRGKDAFDDRDLERLKEAAPRTADFMAAVGSLISSTIPGLPARPLPELPAWMIEPAEDAPALAPTLADAELVTK
jgi:hypothetical protein